LGKRGQNGVKGISPIIFPPLEKHDRFNRMKE